MSTVRIVTVVYRRANECDHDLSHTDTSMHETHNNDR